MTQATSSKVKKAEKLSVIEQLPENVNSAMLEDKIREIIDFLNK